MHDVSQIDAASAPTPAGYEQHSKGFRRANYVNRTLGSVHMGAGICYLDAEGFISPHLHAFEESFYILEGQVILQMGDRAFLLEAGHYGLIHTGVKHAWHSADNQPASWLEMQSPQPRPLDYGRDTFFIGGEVLVNATAPNHPYIGHFDERQLPQPGAPSEMEGFNPTSGVAIKMFVDRSFGAVHQSLFLIQYMPGARIAPHDHTFEESYYILSGQVRAVCDGQSYVVGAGGVVWTSVGCIHSFENIGDTPVRWLETQAPLPPAQEVFRFEHEWDQYR